MALSTWLCTNSSKNMLIKIVYAGGRVELHDRPILATEIMQRNPRCCVAYPDVFRRPWAVVSPDTVLLLGQKYYVVPLSTLRKLRTHSMRNSNSPHHEAPPPGSAPSHQLSTKTTALKRTFCCLKQSVDELDASSGASNRRLTTKTTKGDHQSDDGCFRCLLAKSKPKTQMDKSSRVKDVKKGDKENAREIKGSPNRRMKNIASPNLSYHWQPSLDCISEEQCPDL